MKKKKLDLKKLDIDAILRNSEKIARHYKLKGTTNVNKRKGI